MNDDALTRLEQRIARLEVANCRWRRLAACSAVVLVCAGLMAAQKQQKQKRGNIIKADQIEAQTIIVRDDAGKELITLGKIDNYPGMRIQFPGSRVLASFFTSADHATLALSDNNGSSSVTVNSGGAETNPDLSMVKISPGPQIKRLFRAP
jgi:hypothetical protein